MSDLEKRELKPCPFCGDRGQPHQDSDGEWHVFCEQCDCSTGRTYPTAEAAIAAWNTRTPSTPGTREEGLEEGARRETYSLGLMTEEMGETLKIIGKALRFGLDAPGPASPEYRGLTAREMLPFEVGDLHAAIRWAAMAGVVKMSAANLAEEKKLAKLLSPDSRDANGNRLAPALKQTDPTGREG